MNKNMLVMASILLIASSVPAFGQLRENPDESLRGLKGIRVVVNYRGPAEASYGLTQKELRNTVVLRLTAEGMKVLNDEEWNREPGKPYFYITVVGTKIGSGKEAMFFYSFATDLIQQVSLARRPSFTTDGSTWNQDYALVVSKKHLRQVTVKIGDVAHDFAQSVREANK